MKRLAGKKMIPKRQRKFYRLIEWNGKGVGVENRFNPNDYETIMEFRKYKLTQKQAQNQHGKMYFDRKNIPTSEVITYDTKTDYENYRNGKFKNYY